MIARIPLRLRLTLIFALLMTLLFAAFGVVTFAQTKANLDDGIDRELEARAADVASLIDGGQLQEISGRGDQSYVQVIARSGRPLVSSDNAPASRLLEPREIDDAFAGKTFIRRDESSRLLALPLPVADKARVLVVGESIAERERTLETLGAALLAGGPLAVILASLAVYTLAGRALRPVDRMRRRARQISISDSSDRLPVPIAKDELRALGETLNEMLDGLAATVEHERRFAADVSHELRTPLAILKMELEVGRRASLEDPTALPAAIDSASEEVERLQVLTDDLLLLTRADHAALPLRLGPVNLRQAADRVTRRFALLEDERRPREIRVEVGAVRIEGDEVRIEQALTALVDNSYRHGAGAITISADQAPGRVVVHVTDDGSGFPPEFIPVAFDRFSRARDDRTGGGTGLGLSIVAAIAEAHGGEAGIATGGEGADVWFSLMDQDSL